jgi:phosphate-selective porin|tara:strand:+ start:365 stop:616 length:252 start_codon:yes stop_codon:yes gene_type:complete
MDNKKAEKYAEYIQSVAAIEDCMKPYREQRKELRRNFMDNHWLSKEEISLALKAFRLWENQVDFDNLAEVYQALELSFVEKEE